jgi:hypothetical protein
MKRFVVLCTARVCGSLAPRTEISKIVYVTTRSSCFCSEWRIFQVLYLTKPMTKRRGDDCERNTTFLNTIFLAKVFFRACCSGTCRPSILC